MTWPKSGTANAVLPWAGVDHAFADPCGAQKRDRGDLPIQYVGYIASPVHSISSRVGEMP